MTRRARNRGTALPIVLLLSATMLVTTTAWLQTSLASARATLAARERVQAFHAADSALIRCSRLLDAALPPMSTSAPAREPVQWRGKSSFEGASALAIQPFADWPDAHRAPQCLIETWLRSEAGASYLITARGFGASADSEAWLQLRVDENGARHWRRVVAKPF
jgi:Tfp pilus assembly protein PilX